MLMKSLLVTLCLLGAFIVTQAREKTINLTVSNPTDARLKVNVLVKKSNGTVKRNLELGNVSTNAQVTRTFKVDVDGQFVISALIPGSAQVFEEAVSVLRDDPNPRAVTSTIVLTGHTIDPERSAETLRNLFGRLGPNVGFSPIQVNDALRTVFGGLYLISSPSRDGDAVVHFKLTPTQFSTVTPPDQFQFPGNNDRSTLDILTSATSSVAVTVPVISQIGIDFSRTTAYRIDYELAGFGAVEKIEEAGSSYATRLAALSTENKNALCQSIIRHPTAKLLYINKIYVIQNARFETKQGQRIASGVRASASAIVTGNAAYEYSNEQGRITNFVASVVNIEGVELSFTAPSAGGVTGAVTCDAATSTLPRGLRSILGNITPGAGGLRFSLGVKPISNLSISRRTYEAMSR